MKYVSALISLCLLPVAWTATAHAADPAPPSRNPFPLQLVARVPYAPTAFPSKGESYLAYELHLTNLSNNPITLSRVEVLDADSGKPVTSLEGNQLDALLQPMGSTPPGPHVIAAGGTVVAFMWLSFPKDAHIPDRLSHHVVTPDNEIEGAVIGTYTTKLQVLSPPVHGIGWNASDGPSNDADNHHRRGVLAIDGNAVISRRYAIDWFLHKDGNFIAGDPHDLHSYYDFGQPVYAVADAVVVEAKDGQPDNVPGPVATFHPAVPITMDTVGGNHIVLDLGGGHYAWYFHLHQGSVLVKTGDHVKRGQALAQIGCSGDPPVPHLHFEVTTSSKLLAGEGIPYVFDHYKVQNPDKTWQLRRHELPLDHMMLDLGDETR